MTFAARVLQDPTQSVGELITRSTSSNDPTSYIWFNSGFGGTLPIVSVRGGPAISFNNAKDAVAFVFTGAANEFGLSIYKWSNTGFGTKYTASVTVVVGSPYYTIAPDQYSIGQTVAFSPSDGAIAFGVSLADTGQIPFSVYKWNNTTGFGVRYNPSFTLPNITGVVDLKFSPAGDVFVIVGNVETYVRRWSDSTGYGTAYTLPSAVQTNDPEGVAFTPSGDTICFFNTSTLFAYPWSYASGFGTIYSPSPTIPGQIRNIQFSPAGDAIAIAHTSSPYVSVYPWNSSTGFGTKYANPTNLPLASGRSVAFSQSGKYLAVGFNASPYVYVYPWDASTGFGSRFATPTTIPRGFVTAWRGG